MPRIKLTGVKDMLAVDQETAQKISKAWKSYTTTGEDEVININGNAFLSSQIKVIIQKDDQESAEVLGTPEDRFKKQQEEKRMKTLRDFSEKIKTMQAKTPEKKTEHNLKLLETCWRAVYDPGHNPEKTATPSDIQAEFREISDHYFKINKNHVYLPFGEWKHLIMGKGKTKYTIISERVVLGILRAIIIGNEQADHYPAIVEDQPEVSTSEVKELFA